MIPSKYSAWDKIAVTVPVQDSIFKNWEATEVKSVTNFPMLKGVIVCKDAIFSGSNHVDLYLAFQFLPEGIKLEEISAAGNQVMSTWMLGYTGSIEHSIRYFELTHDKKYDVRFKRINILTGTFLGILSFIEEHQGDADIIAETELKVKSVRKPKKGLPVVSVLTSKMYTIKGIPESAPISVGDITKTLEQSGEFTWVKPQSKAVISSQA